MKPLAEFVMRGPLQGAAVASLATASLFLAWVGAAAVALVALRQGVNRAGIVFLAALLPAVFWMYAGDVGPVTTLVCALVLAQVLRASRSWSVVLLVVPFVLGLWFAAIIIFVPEYVESVRLVFEQILEGVKARISLTAGEAERAAIERIVAPDGLQIMGILAILQALTAVFSVLVARWWQSLLYNPGGFQSEFHALRLNRTHALVLVGAFVLAVTQTSYSVWAWLFIVPLLVAGVALVHGLMASRQLSVRWLVLFYVALLVFRPLLALLAALAVADSAMDFRSRVKADEQR